MQEASLPSECPQKSPWDIPIISSLLVGLWWAYSKSQWSQLTTVLYCRSRWWRASLAGVTRSVEPNPQRCFWDDRHTCYTCLFFSYSLVHAFVQANTCTYIFLDAARQASIFLLASTGTWELASVRLTQVTALACYTGHGRAWQIESKQIKKSLKKGQSIISSPVTLPKIILCCLLQPHTSLHVAHIYIHMYIIVYIYGFTAIAC